jgi:hypothetical protein
LGHIQHESLPVFGFHMCIHRKCLLTKVHFWHLLPFSWEAFIFPTPVQKYLGRQEMAFKCTWCLAFQRGWYWQLFGSCKG